MSKSKIIKTRIEQNFKSADCEIRWGVSVKVIGSRLYCKFPIGYQSFKTKAEAKQGRRNIDELLKNGAIIDYESDGSNGLNAFESVKVQPL